MSENVNPSDSSPEPKDNGPQAPTNSGELRTSPDHETTGWPPGVPYIVGNEGCERFSYYGMKAILYVHLVALYQIAGLVKEAAESRGTQVTHLFLAGVYGLPMIGAILADRLVGKYRTIFYLSLVYCLGHAVLSMWENELMGMYVGLALIALGSGGIKPCVSANVGDQFGKKNWFRVRTVFQIFYFSINFGSFFSTILIPFIKTSEGLQRLGAQLGIPPERNFATSVAFGIPGVLMLIATIIFWMGRKKYVHVPPKPSGMIGFLDTLSSVAFFLSFGHLFFTVYLPIQWPFLILISVGCLALGLLFFYQRQKIQPDDGFLSITLYALQHYLVGDKTAPSRREREDDAWDNASEQSTSVSAKNPDGESSEQAASTSEDRPKENGLANNVFWGPAVRKFGQKATEGPVAVLKIISIFLMVSVFWALFDQHASTWIRQAEGMDLRILPSQGMRTVLPNQIQALNPLFVMILIPVMNLIYAGLEKRGVKLSPLRRMTVGMFIASTSFIAVALIQAYIERLDAKGTEIMFGWKIREGVWFGWQIIPYLLITVAEVMVSITGLEFAYTQAPTRMKSTIMGFWLLTVSLGNVLVAFLAGFEKLPLVKFFWIFAGLMAGAGALFGLRAYFYVTKDYTQD